MLLKNKFSIADLEIATGIKAGTIRIWEKRYKMLNPKRSSRNISYFYIFFFFQAEDGIRDRTVTGV
ncbi:MerR HTH family regulatory protein, partial [Candidatus Kryptobacter tengchongensis]